MANEKKIDEKNSSYIPLLFIPIIFALLKGEKFTLNIDHNQDFKHRLDMLKDIKPYFNIKEKYYLSKVEDALSILNNFSRIRKNDYDNEISSTMNNLSDKERKEKILSNMARYLNGTNKDVIEKALFTNDLIDETKYNLSNHYGNVKTQDNTNIKSILNLLNCFRPVFNASSNKKVKKKDRIIEILNTPN